MEKARVFFLLMGFCAAAPAHAEWLKVATSTDNSKWYMDADRIKSVGSYTQAWLKIDARSDRTVRWSEAKQLVSFDCRAEKYRTLSVITYDSYGKVINSSSQSDYGYGIGYNPVVPDSVMETIEKVACAGSPAAE